MITSFILIIIIGFLVYNLFFSHHYKEIKVALVNGEPIYKKEIDQLYDLNLRAGIYVSKYELLKQKINETLLLQEAKKRNIKVKKEEIDNYIENLVNYYAAFYGSNFSIQYILDSLGITYDEFVDNLKKQMLISKLLNNYIFSNITVDNESIDRFITENNLTNVNESTRELIKLNLIAYKKKELFDQFMKKIYDTAEIKILYDFNISQNSKVENKVELKKSKELRNESENLESNKVKECIKNKLDKEYDIIVVCENCSKFYELKSKYNNIYLLNITSEKGISIINECLKEVYKHYLPEVICLNNLSSFYKITDNLNETLNFINNC